MRLLVSAVAIVGCACATVGAGTTVEPPAATGGLEARHREPELVLVTHRVAKGETLYRIAKAYGLSVDAVMEANQLTDPRELKVGDELAIPGARERRPVPEHDAPEPTSAAGPSPITPGEVAERRRPVKVGRPEGSLQWPIRGVLYARFGKKGKEPHDGIDLAAPAGTPVKTAGAGNVLFAGEQRAYGLIVIVQHPGDLITLYAHNRDLRVKTGQKVREGQVVATVGDSGNTSGPHLHFEVRKGGVPVDPLEQLGPVPPP